MKRNPVMKDCVCVHFGAWQRKVFTRKCSVTRQSITTQRWQEVGNLWSRTYLVALNSRHADPNACARLAIWSHRSLSSIYSTQCYSQPIMLLAKCVNFDICLVLVGEAMDQIYCRQVRCSMMSSLLLIASRLFQLDDVAGSSNKKICCLSYSWKE